MELIHTIEELETLITTFGMKETLTNFYMLNEEYSRLVSSQSLSYFLDEQNLYLYWHKDGFVRLFYFINDVEHSYANDQIQQPQVLEIIYRGEKHYPTQAIHFWNQSGFVSHLSRDCYFLKNRDISVLSESSRIQIHPAHSETELHYAQKLIEENLDLYTGDQLSLEELQHFAEANTLYLAYEEGNLCGMLQAEYKNGVFWLGHLVVDANFRGKGIAQILVEYYLNEGIQRKCHQFQLWVIQDNTPAVNLYKKFGFSYLNRSTCSMLKK